MKFPRMRLTIKRNQADQKGIFGGHKGVNFTLYSKAELTHDERALIERYKVGDHILAEYALQPKGPFDQPSTDYGKSSRDRNNGHH